MRRYKAEAFTHWEGDCEYPEVRMVEAKDGYWVPYNNAQDAVKMLLKRIERLEASNQRYHKHIGGDV